MDWSVLIWKWLEYYGANLQVVGSNPVHASVSGLCIYWQMILSFFFQARLSLWLDNRTDLNSTYLFVSYFDLCIESVNNKDIISFEIKYFYFEY